MSRCSLGGLVLLLAAAPLAVANAEAGDAAETLWTRWSATLSAQYRWIESPQDDDDVGGFFDQYEFTPNKSSAAPFELGLRDGAVDLFRGAAEPLFQLRFQSPTSNLGISGSEIDQPFLNQRLDALARLEGLEVDLSYRRARTEQLRLFPNTEGPGLLFGDLSSADDRFFRDRTGFRSEIRLRPYEAFGAQDAIGSRLAPELSLRGGYQDRDGDAQLRFLRDPSNDWIGLDQDLDRSVSDIGGGLLLAPDGLLTLALDFDYQRFRFDSGPITEGEARLSAAAGHEVDRLRPEQQPLHRQCAVQQPDRGAGCPGRQLPDQRARAGGLVHAGSGRGRPEGQQCPLLRGRRLGRRRAGRRPLLHRDLRVRPARGTTSSATRSSSMTRTAARSSPSSRAGGDSSPTASSSCACGERTAWRWGFATRTCRGISTFRSPENLRILPENAHISRDTQIVTVFGRTALRAWRSLNLSAELGYRTAPETGYIVELDDNFYGQLRASYLFRWRRPPFTLGLRAGKHRRQR